jgi:ABC-type multidrug transport system ATPase subunit
MNKGRCLLIGTPDELREKISDQPVIQVGLAQVNSKVVAAVKANSRVKEVNIKQQEATTLLVSVEDTRLATPEIVRAIVEAEGQILSVNVFRPSLEEAYLKLIKGGETN